MSMVCILENRFQSAPDRRGFSHYVKLSNFRHYGIKHSNCIRNCLFEIECFPPLWKKLYNLAKCEKHLYFLSLVFGLYLFGKTDTTDTCVVGPFCRRTNSFRTSEDSSLEHSFTQFSLQLGLVLLFLFCDKILR